MLAILNLKQERERERYWCKEREREKEKETKGERAITTHKYLKDTMKCNNKNK